MFAAYAQTIIIMIIIIKKEKKKYKSTMNERINMPFCFEHPEEEERTLWRIITINDK